MSSHERRAAARRRAWGRGPAILRFEPLEGRQMLSVFGDVPVFLSSTSTTAADTSSTGSTAGSSVTAVAAAAPSSTGSEATTTAAAATSAIASVAAPTLASGATAVNLNPGYTNVNGASTNATGPDLRATTFDTMHNLDWGDPFTAVGTVQNVGDVATTAAGEVDIYASTSPDPTGGTVLVGTVAVPSGIAAGAIYHFSQAMTAPAVPIPNIGSSTSYFLVAEVAPAGTAAAALAASASSATTTATSSSSSSGFSFGSGSTGLASATGTSAATTTTTTTDSGIGTDTAAPVNSVVTITPHTPANLVGTAVTVGPQAASWGGTVTVTASVTNTSGVDAPATNARIVLTPQGQAVGGAADYQIGVVPFPAVPALQSATATQTITLPASAPTALQGSTSYTVTMIPDADHATNPVLNPALTAGRATTTLSIAAGTSSASPQAAADLKIAAVSGPSPTIYRGDSFPVTATVENPGAGDASSFKVRFLLADATNPTGPALVLGEATVPGLAAGKAQDVTQIVRFPDRLANDPLAKATSAQVIAQVDPDDTVDDSDRSNNGGATTPATLSVLQSGQPTTADSVLATSASTSSVANPSAATPTDPNGVGVPASSTTGSSATSLAPSTTIATTSAASSAGATVTIAHPTAATRAAARAAAHADAVAQAQAKIAARKAAIAKYRAAHTLRVHNPR